MRYRSTVDGARTALALVALIGGGLIAYVPWHYDQLRQTLPPIHDITTDRDDPPAFVAVVPLRQGEGINSVAYEGAKIADQQASLPRDLAADRWAAARCSIRASARDSAADGLDDLSRPTNRRAASKRAKEAAGWALLTISFPGRSDDFG